MSLEFHDIFSDEAGDLLVVSADNTYIIWPQDGKWRAAYRRPTQDQFSLGSHATCELAEAACNKHNDTKFTLGGG